MNKILADLMIKDKNKRLILNAPDYFIDLLNSQSIAFSDDIDDDGYDYLQIFGISNSELLQIASLYIDFLEPNGLVWLCYPNKTSKKYDGIACNHNTVIKLLDEYQYKVVKEIEIDEDFLALGFIREE